MSTRLTYKQRLLECIRIYNGEGLIDGNNEIPKNVAQKFYRYNLKNEMHIPFQNALANLVSCNIIFHPNESGKPSHIVFKPGKLDLILEGKDTYLEKTQNKYVVSQGVGFRAHKPRNPLQCTICNKSFASKAALRQHNSAKGHIIEKLKKQAEKVDFYEESDEVCAAVVQRMHNAPETIFNTLTVFTTTLLIINMTDKDIILDNIKCVNDKLRPFMQIEFKAGMVIPPLKPYKVQLILNFESKRAYDMPLTITYTRAATSAGEGEIVGFNKYLVFEIVSDINLAELRSSAPYRRRNPVASDMDETIIPGEKPEFQKGFTIVSKLQPYLLSSVDLKIFNTGLKSRGTDDKNDRRLREVKQLLDVEEPMRMQCLNECNYREMLDLLLYLDEHQMQIDIRTYDTTTDNLTHVRNNFYELIVPELSENRPSLIVGDSVYLKVPDAKIKYEGVVHMKMENRVRLGFSHKFSSIYAKKMKFQVSFSYNRTTLKLEHQAAFLARHCAKYFFPKNIPSTSHQDLKLNCDNKQVNNNPQQLQAVREIVKGTVPEVPYLIFGPPGTGKTITVVESILQVRKFHPDKRILICAPSNSAANLVCSRLLKYRSFSEKELLRYISYSYNFNEIPLDMLRYCNVQLGAVCHPTLESLMGFHLVITTLTTAGRLYNGGIPRDHFDYVFIDEAGHATETETLIPITAALVDGATVKGRVILAGDPKQLGPLIHSIKAKEYGFGVSMLERLMTYCQIYQKSGGTNGAGDTNGVYDNRVLTKLLCNYRSHPDIIALSNQEFYKGELIPVGNAFSDNAIGHEVLLNKDFPLIFHSVLGDDKREANSPSFFNIQEIDTVFGYLQRLVGSKMRGCVVQAKDIAVITPYRKQVQKIKQMCRKDAKYDELEVGTIEKLQGQERLIVIISTVRSKAEYVQHDVKFHLGFLKNPKRMNVALTRAKALLIVIGNPNLLKHDEHWYKYIQRCKDNNATTGAAFSMDIDEDEAELLASQFENIRMEDTIGISAADSTFCRSNQ